MRMEFRNVPSREELILENRIQIIDKNGELKAGQCSENQVVLAWKGEYEEGDKIIFRAGSTNAFYVIRLDDTMDEAFVYLTKETIVFDVPFEEKKKSYNPKAFTGERHYLTMRPAEAREIRMYKNLARNPMDQHGESGCYPHASANVETRGESVFAARNAIDGILANDSHGRWPYQSWGINMQDDAEMTLEFGRPVDFDKIVLYTRADFPHDNWWEKVTLTFSDGTKEVAELVKSSAPHVLSIERKGITWLKFGELIKADDPSPFPALTQIEVYGVESGAKEGLFNF